MTAKTQTGRVVFTGTYQWWEIVGDEIATGEPWEGRWEAAAEVAGLDLTDEEAWVVRVEEVADRHTAIRVGDYACCQGYGSDVEFVRLAD